MGTVESLVAKGANINIKDDKGVSAEAELDCFFLFVRLFFSLFYNYYYFFWGGGVVSVKHKAQDTQILACSKPDSQSLA